MQSQPREILELICWSVDPLTQNKLRHALRCTCKDFDRKVNPPNASWTTLEGSDRAIALLNNGAALEYIRMYCKPIYISDTELIASAGRLDLLHSCEVSISTCYAAAKYGHLHCLKYLLKFGIKFDSTVSTLAARNGYLDCFVFAHQNGSRLHTNICNIIVKNSGRVDCLKYAHQNGAEMDPDICKVITASSGNLDCLRFAHEAGIKWNADVCRNAAHYGHLQCLIYAHSHGCPLDHPNQGTFYTNILELAAQNGHVDCMIYCHEHGIPLDIHAGAASVAGGSVACLKYYHENGGKWYPFITSRAAVEGHLECLKYAHENGCPWDNFTCDKAATHGHLACLAYAHQNGAHLHDDLCWQIVGSGSTSKHLDCLRYAHENGIPIDSRTVKKAIKMNGLLHLQYIRSTGYQFTKCEYDKAVKYESRNDAAVIISFMN